MAKLTLDIVSGGYDLSIINDNFDKIETEFQNKVLYRNNPIGETNTVETDIDMNGKRIYNLPEPINGSEAARLIDVQNSLSGFASANLISFTPAGTISSDTVQGAIQELDGDIQGHISDPTSAHNSSAIDFLQSGTGTVIRTVGDKLSDTVSVKDFGAVGDGITDDRANIEVAINTLSTAGGGTLRFPDGTYLINSYSADTLLVSAHSQILPLKSNVHIELAQGATLVVGNFFDDKSFILFSGFNHSDIGSFTVISNVRISGGNITFSGATSRMRSGYMRRVGIEFGKIEKGVVTGVNFFDGDLSNGIGAGYDAVGDGVLIEGNTFYNLCQENTVNTDHTTCYMGARNTVVTRNIFRATTTQMRKIGCAVEMHNSHIVTSNNIIENYTRGVWFVSQSSENTFCNNQSAVGNIASITNAFAYIWVDTGCTVTDVTISNNTVSCHHIVGESALYNGYQGILASSNPTTTGDTSNIHIVGNTVRIASTVTAGCKTALWSEKPYSGIIMEENTFYGAVDGIAFTDNTRTLSHFIMRGNTFITTSPASRYINLVASSLLRCCVLNNTFLFDGTAPADAIYIGAVTSATGCAVQGNLFPSVKPSVREVSFTANSFPGSSNLYEYIIYGLSLVVPAIGTGVVGVSQITGFPTYSCTYGSKVRWIGLAPGEIALATEVAVHDSANVKLISFNKSGSPFAGVTISGASIVRFDG